MKNSKVIFIVAVPLIAFAGGGFYAGMKYQQSKSPRFSNFQGSRNGQFQRSKDDLKVGEQILVLGNENSDGSVTAQNIQLGLSRFN